MRKRTCKRPTRSWCHRAGPGCGPRKQREGRLMTSAATDARVSSARQKKDQTIGSQTAALRAHAGQLGVELPEEWVFEDEGHSGATLIEEFARAGTRVEFIKGPRGDSPEDQLMVQFQGMFAEYEKAQLMERYRRGKAYRARSGSVNVLGGAPFGYRYINKTADSGAGYEIIGHEAASGAGLCRGYGYYRTSTRTTNKKICYYRCLGSDDYRYEGGRVCGNKPVRADYLDTVVWDHITHLLADPALIRAEIGKRLEQARTSDPATRQRQRLELELAKAAAAITRMIEAFSEQLITIDELRARMPALRARETNLRGQAAAIDAQLADREAYLKLADNLEGFLAQLRSNTQDASVTERQRVLRLLVKDVLIGPEKVTIRHRIPIRERTTSDQEPSNADTEGDHQPNCPLRWGRGFPPARERLPALCFRSLGAAMAEAASPR